MDPIKAPEKPEDFTLTFENGLPIKLELTEDGKSKTVTDPLEVFLSANSIARYVLW